MSKTQPPLISPPGLPPGSPPGLPPGPPPGSLPIDDVLAQVLRALDSGNLVLIAPPGAGKTTRVPPAVLDAGLAGTRQVYVLEPRRLAARMAAQHVAHERGQQVGDDIGYEVRFDRRVSARTRVRFITEGVLLRKLAFDPQLRDVGVVLVDEFHERHLAGDLALAMVRALQRTTRPDLKLGVMSATLDPEPVARFLGRDPSPTDTTTDATTDATAGAAVVVSQGRSYPVDITYAPDTRSRDALPLPRQVAAAVREACRSGLDGDVLVFLPGAAEIRRSMEACADVAHTHDLAIVPLHGDLSAQEQDRAVAPAPRRKVILATNVAETSITIDGVVCVIDSGLARVARYSPWSGLPSLRVQSISRAGAAQRAGRAGRTRPGRCVRLYHQHDHDNWRAFDAPEVARADLADAALLLYASGVPRLGEFAWFEAPPEASMEAADRLLTRLGAILVDEPGERRVLTDIGRRMLRFPVHPRHQRMLVEAEDRGVARQACTLVALLGQRELRSTRRTGFSGERSSAARAQVSGVSDLLEDMDALAALGDRAGNAVRAHGLDASVVYAVRRVRERLARLCREPAATNRPERHPTTAANAVGNAASNTVGNTASNTIDAVESQLLAVTLVGYPDRVARRRAPGSADLVLAGGGSAVLEPTSVVHEAEFLVALDVREGHGRDTHVGVSRASARVGVSRASSIDPTWLFDLYIDDMVERDELSWNPQRARVEHVSEITYHGLIIDQTRDSARPRQSPEQTAELLAEAAWRAGLERFVGRDELHALRARVGFALSHGHVESPSAPGDQASDQASGQTSGQTSGRTSGQTGELLSDDYLRQALVRACHGRTSFAELERLSVTDLLSANADNAQRAFMKQLDRVAPTHVQLPRRRRVPVHYELDRPPWIESRLQDFFGARTGPTVANGQVPLVMHLLAPNRRAVQVTSDLPGFFERHYPALRRQLMRRYPKHAWPEDPGSSS